MISLIDVLNDYSDQDQYWLSLIKKYFEPEAQFLYLLSPCIAKIASGLKKIRIKNFTLTKEAIEKIVLFRFKQYWLHKIILCVILELNDAKELGLLIGDTPQQRFDSFVKMLANNENRIAFFEKYIVIQDQMKNYLVYESMLLTDVLSRLDGDIINIIEHFGWCGDQYQLMVVEESGDRHGEKSVCIVSLKSGDEIKKIVYKPRCLLIDRGYMSFLEWLNDHISIPLLTPKLLLKNNYGWCEFIIAKACDSENHIKEFYKSMGHLLGLLYLLRGSDVHYENIIAHGKHPIIVDLECFFVSESYEDSDSMPMHHHYFSVLNTLLLPYRVDVKKGKSGFDISGLNCYESQQMTYQVISVEESGTDNMHAIRKTVKSRRHANVLIYCNKRIDPMDYEDDFINGFFEIYNIFIKNKAYLMSNKSPLRSFKNVTSRVLYRSTSGYAKLLSESYHPTLLYSRLCYHRHFSSWLRKKKSLSFLLKSELSQILKGNIPAFYTVIGTSEYITDADDEVVGNNVLSSGYGAVQSHISSNINQHDLKVQIMLIRQSMLSHKVNTKQIARGYIATNTKLNISKKDLLKLCQDFLQEIYSFAAIRSKVIFWPQIKPVHDVWNAAVTSIFLYDGLSGIALVFGLAGKILKDKSYQKFSLQCLDYLKLYLSELLNYKHYFSVGIFSGIGGILYLCQYLNSLNSNHDFGSLENLCFILLKRNIEIVNVESYSELDLISGLSGLIKVLTNYKNTIHWHKSLDLLQISVDIFLDSYPDPGVFSEKILKMSDVEAPLLGFSHGVSGMIFALFSYHHHVEKSDKILGWIEAALLYERSYFSEVHRNWPHLGEGDAQYDDARDHYPVKWCHGAIGIGFCRLYMYENGWRDDYVFDEINHAVNAALTHQPQVLNLCHGVFGNLEFLQFAHQCNFLSAKEFNSYLESVASSFLGGDTIVAELNANAFIPGLMTGKAGIVYGLLRLLDNTLPSILLLSC